MSLREKLLGAPLDAVDCLENVERVAGDVARVGNLLHSERLDLKIRMVWP